MHTACDTARTNKLCYQLAECSVQISNNTSADYHGHTGNQNPSLCFGIFELFLHSLWLEKLSGIVCRGHTAYRPSAL